MIPERAIPLLKMSVERLVYFHDPESAHKSSTYSRRQYRSAYDCVFRELSMGGDGVTRQDFQEFIDRELREVHGIDHYVVLNFRNGKDANSASIRKNWV